MELWRNLSLSELSEIYEGRLIIEEWKDISNYEGHYMISNFGRVKSLKREVFHGKSKTIRMPERILKQKLRKDGYTEVNLAKNGVHNMNRIHSLVGNHFLENKEGLIEINHKKGIKTDNRFHQIEWSTASNNILHSYRELKRKHTVGVGDKNPNYRYFLHALTGIYYTYSELADQFGIQVGLVRSFFSLKDKRVQNYIKV